MAYQGITTTEGSADSLYQGALKINSNFEELYTAFGDGSNLSVTEVVQDAVGSAINAGIQTGISVTYDDTSNAINFNLSQEAVQGAIGSAINAGIQTGISVTYDDVNNRINFSNYNITTTSTSKTLTNLEYCTVTVDGLTITLPSSPSVGDKAMIGISSNFNNTTIARNGSNIMSLAEDMIIDFGYVILTMIYINSTLGWRIS